MSHPLSTVMSMSLAEISSPTKCSRRSIRDVRAAGLEAVELLAEAERLRAEAVADLVEFHAIYGHITEGYLTPQRQLIVGARVADSEANRIFRLVRFCSDHPLLVEQLADSLITLEHADALMKLAANVDRGEFADALPDLLCAAVGVELSVFCDRIRSWRWRIQPEIADEDLDAAYDRRSLTSQRKLFGGSKGQYELDAAGTAILEAGLFTTPDPTDRIDGPRTLAQRRADAVRFAH